MSRDTRTENGTLKSKSAATSNNSAGASITAAELSVALDPSSPFHGATLPTKQKLRERAEHYKNSVLQLDGLEQWECSEDVAQLLDVAASCSKAVYNGCSTPERTGFSIQRTFVVTPTRDGAVKQCAAYTVQRISHQINETTIVFPIRGSETLVDWIVNLNNRMVDASALINSEAISNVSGVGTQKPVLVHEGYLNSAKELLKMIGDDLDREISKHKGSVHVVFTGHSAGGGVASILLVHFISKQLTLHLASESCRVRLSCITFGAPPVFGCNILPSIKAIPAERIDMGVYLSVIHEGDPVPRLDRNYSHVLVDVVKTDPGKATVNPDANTPHVTLKSGFGLPNPTTRPTKELPELDQFALGTLVLIRDANADADPEEDVDAVDLQAYALQTDQLRGHLFANIFAHSMNSYLDTSRSISEGRFNGGEGWLQAGYREDDSRSE